MARKNTQSANTNLTNEQYRILHQLAEEEGIAAYLRRLIAQDAQKQGVSWPVLTPRGKYDRSKTG